MSKENKLLEEFKMFKETTFEKGYRLLLDKINNDIQLLPKEKLEEVEKNHKVETEYDKDLNYVSIIQDLIDYSKYKKISKLNKDNLYFKIEIVKILNLDGYKTRKLDISLIDKDQNRKLFNYLPNESNNDIFKMVLREYINKYAKANNGGRSNIDWFVYNGIDIEMLSNIKGIYIPDVYIGHLIKKELFDLFEVVN